MEKIWKERVKKVEEEIEDCQKQEEIETCLTQMENCLQLLIPAPENFLFSDSIPNDQTNNLCGEEGEDKIRLHGMLNSKVDITVAIPSEHDISAIKGIVTNEDNRHILENLKDQYMILKNRLLPKVKAWAITLTKAGTSEATILLKRTIDIKHGLEIMENKLAPLEMDLNNEQMQSATSDGDCDTDENDFEEDFGDEPDELEDLEDPEVTH